MDFLAPMTHLIHTTYSSSAQEPHRAGGHCTRQGWSGMCRAAPTSLVSCLGLTFRPLWSPPEPPLSFCPTAFLLCALLLHQFVSFPCFLRLYHLATTGDDNSTAGSWALPLKIPFETENTIGYRLWQHANHWSIIHVICHLPSAIWGNCVIEKKILF